MKKANRLCEAATLLGIHCLLCLACALGAGAVRAEPANNVLIYSGTTMIPAVAELARAYEKSENVTVTFRRNGFIDASGVR